MFGSACLVMAQIRFSLIKKIKIGRPEHLLTLHPLRQITFHLCPPPLKPMVKETHLRFVIYVFGSGKWVLNL